MKQSEQRCLFHVVAFTSCLLVFEPASSFAKMAHTVSIENMMYSPATLSPSRGDTIIWINNDLVPHTVTAKDNSFDSKSIEPNKRWKLVWNKKGIFDYKCSFHPTMNGTLTGK